MLLAAECICLIEPSFGIVILRILSFVCPISNTYRNSPSLRYIKLLLAGRVAAAITKVVFISETLERKGEKYLIPVGSTLQIYWSFAMII